MLYARRNLPKRGIKKGIPQKGKSLFGGNSKRGRGSNIPLGFLLEKGMHNLGQRSISPRLSRTLSQAYRIFLLSRWPGCRGQIPEHRKKRWESFHWDKNKTQKSHNGCVSTNCKIAPVSQNSPTVANTASVHPLLPNSHLAMNAVHQSGLILVNFLSRWYRYTCQWIILKSLF